MRSFIGFISVWFPLKMYGVLLEFQSGFCIVKIINPNPTSNIHDMMDLAIFAFTREYVNERNYSNTWELKMLCRLGDSFKLANL